MPGWRARRARTEPLARPKNWQIVDWAARQDTASIEMLNYKGLSYSWDSKSCLQTELFGISEQLKPPRKLGGGFNYPAFSVIIEYWPRIVPVQSCKIDMRSPSSTGIEENSEAPA